MRNRAKYRVRQRRAAGQTGVRLPILPEPNQKQLNFQGTSRSARSHTQRASIFNRRFWESENDTSLFLLYTLNCVFMQRLYTYFLKNIEKKSIF